MDPAHRFESIKLSLIRKMTRLAFEHDAINMAQGFPEFGPPEMVIAAAEAALREGHNQYSVTWGTPLLREAIATSYQRFYGMAVDPETEITVTVGVSEAIMVAVLSFINPGDEVIVLEPAHENYLPALGVAGARPIWVPLLPPDYRLDEDRLRNAFARKPRAIILNTPHNPTGRVFPRESLRMLAELCVEHDVLAITDEIYEHMVFDAHKHIPLVTLPGMRRRTITTSGLSKAYAATGWRIGWAIAPETLTEPMRRLHEYVTICAPTPLQHAAVTALSLPASFYRQVRDEYETRRDKVVTILEHVGFNVFPPEGAYYMMADFTAIKPEMDDVAFAEWLVAERQVAVVPGSSFYHSKTGLGQNIVRFAFPKHSATLDEAGRRLMNMTERRREDTK